MSYNLFSRLRLSKPTLPSLVLHPRPLLKSLNPHRSTNPKTSFPSAFSYPSQHHQSPLLSQLPLRAPPNSRTFTTSSSSSSLPPLLNIRRSTHFFKTPLTVTRKHHRYRRNRRRPSEVYRDPRTHIVFWLSVLWPWIIPVVGWCVGFVGACWRRVEEVRMRDMMEEEEMDGMEEGEMEDIEEEMEGEGGGGALDEVWEGWRWLWEEDVAGRDALKGDNLVTEVNVQKEGV